MKRILFDQGMPLAAALILRGLGWDAVHVRELGMHEAADTEILAYAARESRSIITLDRDFPQILALTAASRPSVVLVRQQTAALLALLLEGKASWLLSVAM